jgi:hypothetical protein
MARTTNPTAYILHSFELKPPPEGPLTLGRIITDAGDPLSWLTSSPTLPIPEHLRYATLVTRGTEDQGIPVKTLDGIGGYHHPETGHPQGDDFGLFIGETQTIHFTPDETYLKQSLEDEEVRTYRESRVESSLFMIVGLKIARGVTAVESFTDEQEESNATKSLTHENLLDFVFAYGLMKIDFSGIEREPQIVPLETVYDEDEGEPSQDADYEEGEENEKIEVVSEDQTLVIEGGVSESSVAEFEVEDENDELVEEKKPAALDAGEAYAGAITITETALRISGGTATGARISLSALKRAKRDAEITRISVGQGGYAEGGKLTFEEDETEELVEEKVLAAESGIVEDDVPWKDLEDEEDFLAHRGDVRGGDARGGDARGSAIGDAEEGYAIRGHAYRDTTFINVGKVSVQILGCQELKIGGARAECAELSLEHEEDGEVPSKDKKPVIAEHVVRGEDLYETPVPRHVRGYVEGHSFAQNTPGLLISGGRSYAGRGLRILFKAKRSFPTKPALEYSEATGKGTVTAARAPHHVKSSINQRVSKASKKNERIWGNDLSDWANNFL